MKKCSKCKQKRTLDMFYKHKRMKGGISARCKLCESEYKKVNRQRIYAREKQKALENPKYAWAANTIQAHKSRGFEVEITAKQLEKFIQELEVCPICNRQLLFRSGHGKVDIDSPTLDRFDNQDFLTLENIIVLCHRCNASKGSRTMKEFYDYCKEVIKNIDKQGWLEFVSDYDYGLIVEEDEKEKLKSF